MHVSGELTLPADLRDRPVFVELREASPGRATVRAVGDAAAATHQVVEVCGAPLVTHLPGRDRVIAPRLAADHLWEAAESLVLASVAEAGFAVVDVGANVGYYTTLLARAVGAAGTVFAFEPEADNYLVLAANVHLHARARPAAGRIAAFRTALGDRSGTAELAVFEGNLGLHALTDRRPGAGTRTVPLARLDDLRFGPAAGAGLPLPRIGLIKADIQGAELPFLRGAERTLAADRPVLCLELEPYLTGAARCREMVAWLGGRGYARLRVFHANGADAEATVRELTRPLTVPGVLALIDAGGVGPYGSLLAVPDRR